jgi:glucose-6-phosphate 1-dehydrogenase
MNKISANMAAPADPCCFVIFGASGDLTHRLLAPALYNLAAAGLLPNGFAIIGTARGEKSNDAFRNDLAQAFRQFATRNVDEGIIAQLLSCASYVNGAADDPATYERLDRELARVERACPTGGNRLFYLATPPTAFVPISRHLGQSGIGREKNGAWRRLIIEKPFGTDLASAQALNRELLELLGEHQIYRIDHYLGKETVQNIMVLRFANGLFEPIWNRDHIDHVQITVA